MSTRSTLIYGQYAIIKNTDKKGSNDKLVTTKGIIRD
uniref:Uncharacterized protein n=1 Tax=Tetranychus urticae TaxID=32264 RepID=T1JVF5_TETUR